MSENPVKLPADDNRAAESLTPAGRPPQQRVTRSERQRSLRTPSWFDLIDPRQPEAFLGFCSAWCSMQLWIWPDQFAAENHAVSLAVGLRGHERFCAAFGLVAAVLKFGGLAARMSARCNLLAAGMRASGLFMSIVFWMVIGLSLMLDLPHSVTPIALTGLGIGAFFELAVQRDPRETWR